MFGKKKQPTYRFLVATAIDGAELTTTTFTPEIVKRLLDGAGISYQIREGDSCYENDFFVASNDDR